MIVEEATVLLRFRALEIPRRDLRSLSRWRGDRGRPAEFSPCVAAPRSRASGLLWRNSALVFCADLETRVPSAARDRFLRRRWSSLWHGCWPGLVMAAWKTRRRYPDLAG